MASEQRAVGGMEGAYRPQRDDAEDGVHDAGAARRLSSSAQLAYARRSSCASTSKWPQDAVPLVNMTARDRLWQAFDDPSSSKVWSHPVVRNVAELDGVPCTLTALNTLTTPEASKHTPLISFSGTPKGSAVRRESLLNL